MFFIYWLSAFILPFISGSIAWAVFQIIGGPLGDLTYWTVWGIAFFGSLIVTGGIALSEMRN
jgi:hypothetical protein